MNINIIKNTRTGDMSQKVIHSKINHMFFFRFKDIHLLKIMKRKCRDISQKTSKPHDKILK